MEWWNQYQKQIDYCAYCPKLCRFACPVAQADCRETVTPTGKAAAFKLIASGLLPFDHEAADLIYRCTSCGIARTYCEHNLEVFPWLEAVRAWAVKTGAAPAAVMAFAATWQEHGNPFGRDLRTVLREQEKEEKFSLPTAEAIFFPGCSVVHYFPNELAGQMRILGALGIRFSVYEAEQLCCGYPLLVLGHEDLFRDQARQTAQRLEATEVVISPCPACVYILRERYAQMGIFLRPAVKHLLEIVAPTLSRLSLSPRPQRKVIYHDPCYLGRYLNVYEEPREILAAALGARPKEFFENRAAAACCGGGAGLAVVHPETAHAIAARRREAAMEAGAELIATACPLCQHRLNRPELPAADVISLLAQGLV